MIAESSLWKLTRSQVNSILTLEDLINRLKSLEKLLSYRLLIKINSKKLELDLQKDV